MTGDAVPGLVEWLRAQLDEDQRVAESATIGLWSIDDTHSVINQAGVRVVCSVGMHAEIYPSPADGEHIARWDPARVLAEVAAKREILRRFESAAEWTDILRAEGAASGHHARHAGSLLEVLVVLATLYRDRPGWRAEWAEGHA